MPSKQEDNRRDVLVVAIGTASIGVVRSSKEILRTRYKLEDKCCRVHYLLVDTDSIPEGEDHIQYENTYRVRLADEKGRENGHEYKNKIVAPNLEDLKDNAVLPRYVTTGLLDHELLNRMETGEANKNPLKGYLYLLANLRRFQSQLAAIKSRMTASDRTIYVIYSPISGTAAGAWFLITSFLFQQFETSSPILINLMPSRLEGDEDHKNRNYAIFGWSARLLDVMVKSGISLHWEIPQLTKPPIQVTVKRREPLYALLQSAYRNRGDAHLALDDFFQVMAELLCLAIIGKQNTLGPPSADSQITNTETDQRMGELEAPDKPTRRFASRGYCAVRYNAKLAKHVTHLGIKDAVLELLVPGPNQQSSQKTRSPVEPLSQKTLDEVKEHLTDHLRRKVRGFYREWKDSAEKAFGELFPSTDVDTTIVKRRATFSQDLADNIKNLRGDGTDEAPVRQQIWEVLQSLLDQYGFGLFRHLSEILDSIRVDDGFIIKQQLAKLERYQTVSEAIDDAQRSIERYQRQLSYLKAKPKELERPFQNLLYHSYTRTLLEILSGEYADVLNDAVRYFVVELQHVRQRLENIYDENSREYSGHSHKLNLPIGSYLDERTYSLAKDKIEKYSRNVALIVRDLFQMIDHYLDRDHLGQEELSARIDEAISNQEGIDEFPKDIVEVVRRVALSRNLLRQLLAKGRALTRLTGTGYERSWCIWHSGQMTPALREALIDLEASINNILSDEAFKVIVNDGPLPLRSEEDVELVLAETILDFPLEEVETDKSMRYYWDQDDKLFSNGTASVHRVHTDLVDASPIFREWTHRKEAGPSQQEESETNRQDRANQSHQDDAGASADSPEQSDKSYKEDLDIAVDKLGMNREEVESEWEAVRES